MTRTEHIAWCKRRALGYVDMGDLDQAFASIMSDIRKHPETENPTLSMLVMSMKMGGQLNTPQEMRDFINGFN